MNMLRASVLGLAILAGTPAIGRDAGQWADQDPVITTWYKSLMQPDNPMLSCCGTADAYWCDDVSVKGEQVFCGITDDRDDALLSRPHRPIGTQFEIPKTKYKYDAGNPTGHQVIFVRSDGQVLCFIQGGGA